MKGSAAKSFVRFTHFSAWVYEQDRKFTAELAAARTGNSVRTVYRYIQRMRKIDPCIQGQAGIGYLYRKRRKAA